MAFLKKWHKKGKGKDKDKPTLDLKNGEEDEDFELPPSFSRSKERNLSISRSGRHKVKSHQRTTVITGEVYSPDGVPESAPAWPQTSQEQNTRLPGSGSTPVTHAHNVQSNTTPNAGGGGYHCREPIDTSKSKLSGSQRMTRAPTAV